MPFARFLLSFALTCLSASVAFAADANSEGTDSETEIPDTYIAVAANGSGKNANISDDPANASHFLLFSELGKFVTSVANKYEGKPMTIAKDLSQREATVLIAGKFSKKMQNALTVHDMNSIVKTGNAEKAILSLLQCEPEAPAKKPAKKEVSSH